MVGLFVLALGYIKEDSEEALKVKTLIKKKMASW